MQVDGNHHLSSDFSEGARLWAVAQEEAAGVELSVAISCVREGAALLLRIAVADDTQDGRAVERWLRNVGLVASLGGLAVRAATDWLAGEGPRSGGGAATSGAGAQRKEGVQPPGELVALAEVQQCRKKPPSCSRSHAHSRRSLTCWSRCFPDQKLRR